MSFVIAWWRACSASFRIGRAAPSPRNTWQSISGSVHGFWKRDIRILTCATVPRSEFNAFCLLGSPVVQGDIGEILIRVIIRVITVLWGFRRSSVGPCVSWMRLERRLRFGQSGRATVIGLVVEDIVVGIVRVGPRQATRRVTIGILRTCIAKKPSVA
jgi:hypothetical protein